MKKRVSVALVSHFVILALVLPILVRAKSSDILKLVPEVKKSSNSQTMDLLAGYLNTNPTSIGGPVVAIVDGTALSASGEDVSAYVEAGNSGTGQISTYIVRQGDTLGQIADMFNVSVNTIMWANDLKTKTLKAGQQLVILPISGIRYNVKSGDTVASIAKKYSAKSSDILDYNNLASTVKLKVGDEIIIPDGEMASINTTSSATAKIASGLKEAVGYYLRPIVGGRKSQGLHGHNGVDLAAPIGTPIMAAADGTVTVSRTGGYNGGYGTYVVISHDNGTQTVYGHMSANYVSVGSKVNQGDMIGRIGMTGNTSGPHVHFEVRGAKNPF